MRKSGDDVYSRHQCVLQLTIYPRILSGCGPANRELLLVAGDVVVLVMLLLVMVVAVVHIATVGQ